jgi:hypothetical protein
MLHLPKNGVIGLNVLQSFACLPAIDNEEPDPIRWSYRHVIIRAASTAVLAIIVVILSLY